MNMVHELPDARQYGQLREAAGLAKIADSAAETALSRSLFGVCARDESENLQGMGRVIGDGACHYQIVDLIVHPDSEGRPIAQQILQELTAYVERNAPEGASFFVISDLQMLKTYQESGFELIYPDFYGMSRKLK